MIYNFYLYNRKGQCLYYEEWNRRKPGTTPVEDQKLMFGLLYSLRAFTTKVSPKGTEGFHSYKTSKYKLHYYETATGLKFVLNTDPHVGDLRECLRILYSSIYVEYVVKNPLYKTGQPITGNELFNQNLQRFIRSLSQFNS